MARELRVVGRVGKDPLEVRISIDSLPADATDVAVLAQRANQGEIIGATRLALSSSLESPGSR